MAMFILAITTTLVLLGPTNGLLEGTETPEGCGCLSILTQEQTLRLHLEDKVQRQETLIQQFNDTVKNLMNQVKQLQTDVKTKEPNIAFDAFLSHDVGDISHGHVVVFDQVKLNLGSAYDARHGIFRAPYNGTYQFSMTMASPKVSHFYMMKNSKVVEYVFVGNDNTWETAGISTVMQLAANDDVWVEADGGLYGTQSNGRIHTAFSGFLIRRM